LSYARWSWSDLYIYLHVDGFLICHCGGSLEEDFTTTNTDEMVAHVREHRANGEDAPEEIEEGLLEEKEENDRFMSDPEYRAQLLGR
jgi:hypothetical protein